MCVDKKHTAVYTCTQGLPSVVFHCRRVVGVCSAGVPLVHSQQTTFATTKPKKAQREQVAVPVRPYGTLYGFILLRARLRARLVLSLTYKKESLATLGFVKEDKH